LPLVHTLYQQILYFESKEFVDKMYVLKAVEYSALQYIVGNVLCFVEMCILLCLL